MHHWGMYCFSGPRRELAVQLFALPRDIIRKDLVVLLLSTDDQGGAWMFVRDGDLTEVHEWQAASLDDLPEAVLSLLSSEVGPSDAVSVLSGLYPFTARSPALPPASARGAFGLPLDGFAGDSARACVLYSGAL